MKSAGGRRCRCWHLISTSFDLKEGVSSLSSSSFCEREWRRMRELPWQHSQCQSKELWPQAYLGPVLLFLVVFVGRESGALPFPPLLGTFRTSENHRPQVESGYYGRQCLGNDGGNDGKRWRTPLSMFGAGF
jgi:hypothetical protein